MHVVGIVGIYSEIRHFIRLGMTSHLTIVIKADSEIA